MDIELNDRQREIRRNARISVITQAILFFIAVAIDARAAGVISSDGLRNITLDTLCLLISIFFYTSTLLTWNFTRLDVRVRQLLGMMEFYLFADIISWAVDGIEAFRTVSIIDNTAIYILTLILARLYWYFLCAWERVDTQSKEFRRVSAVIDVIFVIDLLFIIGNLWGGYIFTVTEPGAVYTRSATFNLSVIAPTLILLISIFYIFRWERNRLHRLILMIYPLAPYMGLVVSFDDPWQSMISVNLFCSIAFMFSTLYVMRMRRVSFRRIALAESQLSAMQAQIRPHFIANMLASIEVLCEEDPEAAQDLTRRFAGFLRDRYQNIRTRTVGFDHALDQLVKYIEIEQIRFPNIRLELDIRARDFIVPTFCMQPLVENAIKHGICTRKRAAGTISIASRETRDAYIVTISDDGSGFDTDGVEWIGEGGAVKTTQPNSEYSNDTERLLELASADRNTSTHIGITNTARRLKLLCGGTLTIQSRIGEGTTATISIPRKAKK